MKVLYVEDDARDADLTRRELARIAPQVHLEVVATLGEARARLTEGASIDVVLTDLQLPDGSGLELVAEVRERALPLAVVALTGSDAGEIAVAALKAGADDYLVKRSDYLARLPQVLAAALARHQAEVVRHASALRVLYAEDSASDTDLTRRHFARHARSIRLEAVNDVAELLRRLPRTAAEPSPCDVLLLDCRLTGANALDVLKTLRDERQLDLPVVLVTGQGDGEVAAQAFRFGAASYVVKHSGYLFELPAVLEAAHDRARLMREEARLRENEAFVRSVLDSLTAHVAVLDAQGTMVAVNQSWRDFALRNGATPETADPVGASYLAFCTAAIPQGDDQTAQLASEGIQAVLNGARARFSLEYPCNSPDAQRWFLMSVSRRLGPHGGVTIAHENITERKLAERALRQSEERFRTLFEQAAVGVAELDSASGRFVRVNRRYADLVGYSPEEMLQQTFQVLTHPDDLSLDLANRERLKAGEVSEYSVEKRYLRKDGSILWVHLTVSPIRKSDGSFDRHIAIVKDITERKQAEAALRESELKYRNIYENIQDVYVETSSDGTIIEISPQIEELTGGQYRRDDVLGRPVAGIYADPDRRELLLRALNETGSVKDFESAFRNRDGSLIPCSISARLVRDGQGRPQRLVSTIRDITERKRTEHALQLLSTGVAHLRGEAFFNRLSAYLSKLLGMEIGFVAKLLGPDNERMRTIGLCIDGELTPSVEYGLAGTPCEAAIRRGEAIFADQVRRLFPSARILADLNAASYAAVPLFDSNGRTTGTVGVMGRAPLRQLERVESILRLFAVRAAAEMEREAVEQRFQDLFEYSPDANLIVNQAGRITLANRQAEALFGYAGEELMRMSVDDLMPPADRRAHESSRRGYFLNPVSRSMGGARAELHAQRKDGTVFPADISLNPLHSDEGTLVVATVRDITARLEAEQQRQGLEMQLRQSHKMEAIGTLAGGIAHDFNNIVSAIIGNVELAREDVGADHPAMQSLDEIGKASRRARDLVSQILAFSRQQPEPRHTLVLPPVVEEVVKLLRATLPAGVELGTTLAADAPNVLADPTQIHQVLMNLCANAWHAMDDGRGRIDIQLDSVVLGEDASRIDAELSPGRYARLSVSDSGRGMDAITRERIFEPFFTTKAVGEGTGLGLSVVHGIMRGYQGAITLDSQPGSGSTFHLYFPAADAAAETAAAERAIAPSPRGRGQQVLYLDDDESLVILVTRTLERNGYRVAGYTDSAQALQALRAEPWRFDLVVTDFNMPGMSGLDVAQEVSRIHPDLPVVVTSGYITDELREKAPLAGVRQLVYKPNSAEDLCETVRRLLDQGN
jgi:two-component system cell cycle sensor histidine kinase/response regulator CckA